MRPWCRLGERGAGGGESEVSTVGRPRRGALAAFTKRDLPGIGAIGIHDPEVGARFMALTLARVTRLRVFPSADGVHDSPAVGGDDAAADAFHLHHVVNR